MRVLVIGAGSIGRRHAGNLASLGAEVEHLPFRATSPDDLAARARSGRYAAAVVATATDQRLAVIAPLAAAGLPLYIEKPLAFRSAELAAILAATAPVASRSMLGLMMRYHRGFAALAGEMRQPFRFAFTIGHDVTQWRPGWRFSESYAARAEGGGVLLDLCHEIDMAACLFPGLMLEQVDSLGHAAYPGVDMSSRITLSAPGVQGVVAMDYLCPRLVREARIDGLAASVTVDFAAGTGRRIGHEAEAPLELAQDRNAMFLAAMADFLALVSGRATSGNPHLPRLDLCRESASLTVAAWEARTFRGRVEKELP